MSNLDFPYKTFKGDIVTSSDAGYTTAIERWALNAVRPAKVVAFVRDETDVAIALRYAQAAHLPIAVRSGGHSHTGTSSVEDGLVVDLSRYLTRITVNETERTACVQAGALWKDVIKETMKVGLAAVSGIIGHVGVGGLATGGGFGWLSPEHGLTIDNILQATVVTASGSILSTSRTEHPDLFWGIRGGNSNFGVVTEFVFRLHPQRSTVFAGPIIYGRDKVEALGKAVERWLPQASMKEGVSVVITRGPDGTPCVVAHTFYNGSEAEGRAAHKLFSDLGPIADLRQEMTYEALSTMMDNEMPFGKLHAWMHGYTGKPALELLTLETFDAFAALSENSPFRTIASVDYIPLGKVNNIPVTDTAYRRSVKACRLGGVYVLWDEMKPGLEEKAKAVAEEVSEIVGTPGVTFGNFSAYSHTAPAAGVEPDFSKAEEYFGENYERLQRIKRRYDPEMVFNKWFVVQPAAVENAETD